MSAWQTELNSFFLLFDRIPALKCKEILYLGGSSPEHSKGLLFLGDFLPRFWSELFFMSVYLSQLGRGLLSGASSSKSSTAYVLWRLVGAFCVGPRFLPWSAGSISIMLLI